MKLGLAYCQGCFHMTTTLQCLERPIKGHTYVTTEIIHTETSFQE